MIGRSGYGLAAAAAHGVTPALALAWREATRRSARDDTAGSARRSCLVIAPHPDDETIGCGATIARKRAAGTDVAVVIVADGRHAQARSRRISATHLADLRRAEAEQACKELGVQADDLIQLGHEDTQVHRQHGAVVDALVDLLRQRRPQEVLVVSSLDHHPDHRTVARAATEAILHSGLRPLVLEYPVWSWIDGPWRDQQERSAVGRAVHLFAAPAAALARGRARAVRTGRYAEAKRAALAAHATQTTAYTDEADWAVMDDRYLGVFPSDVELFLPVRRAGGG